MKNIRTDMLKESIAEYENIAKSIKENSSEIINELLREAVADEYVKILAEDFAQDEDEEEVKDTETETEVEETPDETEEEFEEESEETVENNETDDSEGSDDWKEEFSEFKTDDEEETYDLSNTDDETVVKLYKRLSDSDEIAVKMDKESNKATIKALGDIPAGTEFIVELNDECDDDECTFEDASEEYNNDINESKMIEIVLNEDANLGYTTKYQKTDAMTTPPMTEPGKKHGNDWDAGVPKGKERPYGNKKVKSTPYTNGEVQEEENVPVKQIDGNNGWGMNGKPSGDKFKNIDKNWKGNSSTKEVPAWGTNLSENETVDVDDIEEGARTVSSQPVRKMTKTPVSEPRKEHGPYGKHCISTGGKYVGSVEESMKRKHNKIMQENKALKQKLAELKDMLMETQVTTASIGYMNRLMTENTVAQDEKKEIYKRFNNVKDVKEARSLYEQIKLELQKKDKMNINEDKQFTVENSQKINENTIYASKDLMDSLNIMHKICR